MTADTWIWLLLYVVIILMMVTGYSERSLIKTQRKIIAAKDKSAESQERIIAAQTKIIAALDRKIAAQAEIIGAQRTRLDLRISDERTAP